MVNFMRLTMFACNCTPNTVVSLPTKMAVGYIMDLGVTPGAEALWQTNHGKSYY